MRVSILLAERAFEARNFFLCAIGLFAREGFVRRIIFVAFCEIGTFPPIGARDDVHFAVVIEIAVGSPFAPEIRGQLSLLKSMQRIIARPLGGGASFGSAGSEDDSSGKQCNGGNRSFVHVKCLS